MSKRKVNLKLIIKDVKPIFDKYTKLKAFPIFVWGRYYKYELAGEEFDSSNYSFSEMEMYKIEDIEINWKMIKEIEESENVEDILIPDRKEWAYEFGDDGEYGGSAAVAVKDENGKINIQFYNCDSPE